MLSQAIDLFCSFSQLFNWEIFKGRETFLERGRFDLASRRTRTGIVIRVDENGLDCVDRGSLLASIFLSSRRAEGGTCRSETDPQ